MDIDHPAGVFMARLYRCLVPLLLALAISCASGHRAPLPEDPPPVRDLPALLGQIETLVAASPCLSLEKLESVQYGAWKAPMLLVRYRPATPVRHRVLIDAGIHGNEPASVASALAWIGSLARGMGGEDAIACDILPLVNPWGWVHDQRFNRDGIDVNRDFSRFRSQEAKILRRFLTGKTYDSMIDLHEDPQAEGFYLYHYAGDDQRLARSVIDRIRSTGHPVEQNVRMVTLKTVDGLINAPLWGLWYMRLTGQLSLGNFYRLENSASVYTVETPTRLPWKDRLEIHRSVLEMLAAGLL